MRILLSLYLHTIWNLTAPAIYASVYSDPHTAAPPCSPVSSRNPVFPHLTVSASITPRQRLIQATRSLPRHQSCLTLCKIASKTRLLRIRGTKHSCLEECLARNTASTAPYKHFETRGSLGHETRALHAPGSQLRDSLLVCGTASVERANGSGTGQWRNVRFDILLGLSSRCWHGPFHDAR